MLLGLSGSVSVKLSETVAPTAQAMFTLWPTALIILLVIILLTFGGAKLPQLARGIGQGLKEFKDASRESLEDGNDDKEKDKEA